MTSCIVHSQCEHSDSHHSCWSYANSRWS